MELVVAILGACIGAGGILLLERYKRVDDRRGIASAIAGEISALILTAETRKLSQYFQGLAGALRTATPPAPPWVFYDLSYKPTPVLDAYMDRIGALGGRLPERVVYFYSLYAAIRLETKVLASGFYNAEPLKAAAQIDAALAIWNIAQPHAQALVADLQAFSGGE